MSLWDRVVIATPPASPVDTLLSLDAIRRHVVIDDATSDGELTLFLREAVAMIDGPQGIGYALLEQSWRLSLDCFPGEITLPGAPVQSVDEIVYHASDGTLQTLASSDYAYDLDRSPVVVRPAYGKSWPATRYEPGAIKITYSLGLPAGDDVNPRLMTALLLHIGYRDKFREGGGVAKVQEYPMAISSLLRDFRQFSVTA